MLNLIVFICGAVVMILEIAGSRVLAPYCGTSVIVWSSLIGVILGFLSLGYYLGGRLADAHPTRAGLSLVILCGSAATALIAMSAPVLLPAVESAFGSSPLAAVLGSLLFAPASLVLGMVSPYGVRLAIEKTDAAGQTAGALYAVSTLGSIVGTFLAGFVLLAAVGTYCLIWILAAILATTSLIGSRRLLAVKLSVLAACLAGLAVVTQRNAAQAEGGYIDADTRYSRVVVSQGRHRGDLRPIRMMTTSPRFVQSAMFLDAPSELVLDYTKYYTLAPVLAGEAKRILVLGGAGYSFPKFALAAYPDARVDVVELDPGVTALARAYFALTDNPRLRVFDEDARTYLNRCRETYDVVLVDAFGSIYSVPFHLTTREAVAKIHGLLRPGGVVMLNMVSSLGGATGRFFQSERATYASLFPAVLTFALVDPNDASRIQNIVMAAVKEPVSGLAGVSAIGEPFKSHLASPPAETALILTDAFAPVDYFMTLVELGDAQ